MIERLKDRELEKYYHTLSRRYISLIRQLIRDDFRGDLAERSKKLARIIRNTSSLGYSGNATKLTYEIGGKNVLEAKKPERGNWCGAPAMEYDEGNDRILTHIRHRNPMNRGYQVSICRLNTEELTLHELVSVNKQDINAKSLEGGELIEQDGEFRWFISYQHQKQKDWRIQERRASTIKQLGSGGEDINPYSSYFHNKDPVFVNGDFYTVSYSRNWLNSKIERMDIDQEKPTVQELDVAGNGNARITSGGILGNEIFADKWPNFPGVELSNILWLSSERGTLGTLSTKSISINPSVYFVSACGGSLTYLDAEKIGDSIYLMWQEEKNSGNNDLLAAKIDIREYRELFQRYL